MSRRLLEVAMLALVVAELARPVNARTTIGGEPAPCEESQPTIADFLVPVDQDDASSESLFRDPKDGWFDVSRFLDSRIGFLPVVFPITEPAVGYGAGGALVFFHTPPRAIETPDGTRVLPPITTAVAGMATENGSWAGAGGHLHWWDDGRIRYSAGGGYASLNLDWFGRSDAFKGQSFSYNIDGAALVQKLSFKIGDSDFFVGPTQRLLTTKTKFDDAASLPPIGITPAEENTTVSGLGVAIAYDTRNSFFSPTHGTKAAFNLTFNDHLIGSDFDYRRMNLEVCHYLPIGGPFTLGLRGDVEYASDDAPFFDLAAVSLRGIPADRYMDDAAMTLETEVRWDIARWSLIGFTGVGWTSDELHDLVSDNGHWAGGAGFRYLIAREYDMRLGADIAVGPDGWTFYLTVGTGWLRD